LGDWFTGLSETPSDLAFDCTAPGVRPSFSPATRVGVFPFVQLGNPLDFPLWSNK
jgi:hypothetical protein